MASNMAITTGRIMKFKIPNIPRLQADRPMSTVKPAIRDKMEKFGMEDGTPVFQKGGSFDGILHKFTMGLCVGSLGLIAANIYGMAAVKK